MIKIGVFACQNTNEIINALILLLKDANNSVAINANHTDDSDFDVDYLLIPFEKNNIPPISLDILILDNPTNERIVTYDLIKDINDNTILIYSTDNGYLPKIKHPNAIDYGFSQDSTVGISSVNYYSGGRSSFMISIAENIKCINKGFLPVCEILINSDSDIKIENRIPAVICSLICKNNIKNQIKI